MPATVTLTSAAVQSGGTAIFVLFDSHGGGSLSGNATGFTCKVDGVARNIANIHQPSGLEIDLFLDSSIFVGDTVTVSVVGSTLVDGLGNTIVDAIDFPATNGSQVVGQLESADSWYYSNRAGVATLIDKSNIASVWDLDGDGIEDAGKLQYDGTRSDAYINVALAQEGLPVPVILATAPDYVVAALADVSNHLTVWYGWTHRGIQELSRITQRTADDIAGMMSGYKTYADEQLAKLARVINDLTTVTGSSAGRIMTSVAPPKLRPGYGNITVPAYQLPEPTGTIAGSVSY